VPLEPRARGIRPDVRFLLPNCAVPGLVAVTQAWPAEFGTTPEEDSAGVVAVLLLVALGAATARCALRR
jgi:hypothetical protein